MFWMGMAMIVGIAGSIAIMITIMIMTITMIVEDIREFNENRAD